MSNRNHRIIMVQIQFQTSELNGGSMFKGQKQNLYPKDKWMSKDLSDWFFIYLTTYCQLHWLYTVEWRLAKDLKRHGRKQC
jgi:hypothetical protein